MAYVAKDSLEELGREGLEEEGGDGLAELGAVLRNVPGGASLKGRKGSEGPLEEDIVARKNSCGRKKTGRKADWACVGGAI